MSVYYKCDRCGKTMDEKPRYECGEYAVYEYGGLYDDDKRLDLCEECRRQFEEWLGKFSLHI